MHCLLLQTIDSLDRLDEAMRLRAQGHSCDVLLYQDPDCDALPRPEGVRVFHDLNELPLESGKCDLILSGRIGKMTRQLRHRVSLANELARVCKPDGALLATFGNRLCPLDISGNASLFHGPFSTALLSTREAKALFLEQATFTSVELVGIFGHFGWSKVSGTGRLVALALDLFWRKLATPQNPGVYGSPLNPCFLLWVNR